MIHDRCQIRETALTMAADMAKGMLAAERVSSSVLRANLPRRLRNKSIADLAQRVGRDALAELQATRPKAEERRGPADPAELMRGLFG